MTDTSKRIQLPEYDHGTPKSQLAAAYLKLSTAGALSGNKINFVNLLDLIARGQQYAQSEENRAELTRDWQSTISYWRSILLDKIKSSEDEEEYPSSSIKPGTLPEDFELIPSFFIDYPTAKRPLTTNEWRELRNWARKVDGDLDLGWFREKNQQTAYYTKALLKRWVINFTHQRAGELCCQTLDPVSANEIIAELGEVLLIARLDGVFDNRGRDEQGRWQRHHLEKSQWSEAERKSSRFEDLQTKRVATKKKNSVLNKLPLGWYEELAAAMGYPAILDMLFTTGMRLAEIESALFGKDENNRILFLIKGKKVTEANGQHNRVLHLNMTTCAAQRILALCPDGKSCSTPAVNRGAFRKTLARASNKLFGPKITISPVCFRHNVAQLLKSDSSFSEEQIAKALGHRSTRMQAFYGNKTGKQKQKTAAVSPITRANGSDSVRLNKAHRYLKKRPEDLNLKDSGKLAIGR